MQNGPIGHSEEAFRRRRKGRFGGQESLFRKSEKPLLQTTGIQSVMRSMLKRYIVMSYRLIRHCDFIASTAVSLSYAISHRLCA